MGLKCAWPLTSANSQEWARREPVRGDQKPQVCAGPAKMPCQEAQIRGRIRNQLLQLRGLIPDTAKRTALSPQTIRNQLLQLRGLIRFDDSWR
jgi:hypothetical protein